MKNRTMVAIAAIAIAGFSSCGVSGRTDRILRKEFPEDQPGIAVGIVKRGEVTYSDGFGLANLAGNKPFTVDTVTNIGGLSQVFTATAALILIEGELLSLDDPITEFFSDAPAEWRAITVRHLINHTSGLREYFRDLEEMVGTSFESLQLRLRKSSGVKNYNSHVYNAEQFDIADNDWVYRNVRDGELVFEPGSEFEYTNTNYVLLSLIVERVSGDSFEEFVDANIFDVLGMTDTVVSRTLPTAIPELAAGYRKQFGVYEKFDASPKTTGDTNVYTNVSDMQKYFQGLFSEKLLSEDTLRETYEGYNRLEKIFAYGWFLSYYVKTAMLADHGGASGGFRAYAATVPERDLSVIAMTNGALDTLDQLIEILVYNAL